MKAKPHLLAVVAVLATTALLATGSALAAFPNLSDCPRSTPGVTICVDVQSIRGSLEIKGFTVPLGDSLEIRGGLITPTEGSVARFAPPAGTNGFFSKSIQIPGGLLGIEFPIPGNAVTGTAQLAGPASSILFDVSSGVAVRIPVKLKLDNPILGPNCYIGSNSNPVRLNLTSGTTSPPPPNRPISGFPGNGVFEEGVLIQSNAVNVDNSFAVPGASGCGLGLGLISAIVNAKLRLPSAGGNNTMIVENNIAIGQ